MVTIIVLIILSGVSIYLVLGNNGIITKAKQTARLTKEETIIEKIKLEILEKQIQGVDMSKSSLIAILLNYGTIKEEEGKIVSIVLEDDIEIAIERIYEGTIIDDNATYIYTKEQLETFRDSVNSGKTYENETIMLMNDIDLEGNENDETTWWTPIGLDTQRLFFMGTFNGNNNKISRIYVFEDEEHEAIGFFGTIANATIKNVTVSGTVIANGNGDATTNPTAGGLVGQSYGKSLIENCRNEADVRELSGCRDAVGILASMKPNTNVTSITIIRNCSNVGNITGGNNCAGIAGYMDGELIIENCYNEGTIENTLGDNVGGLVAKNSNESSKVTINNCYNIGTVEGNKFVGGCIGMAYGPVNINTFYNIGDLSSTLYECAGVIGYISGQSGIIAIENAYNTGNIEGYRTCGGIIGYGGPNNTIVISNTYNTGNITSVNREAGGIIGDTDAINYLINVYNTGNCMSNTSNENSNANGSSGGIIGSCYNVNTEITIVNAYNTGETRADRYASGILGARSQCYKLNIINVYNNGILNGKTGNCGIIASTNLTEMSKNYRITNAYYIDNVEIGSNLENNNTTRITEEYIKSDEFVNELNKYVEENPVYQIDDNTSIKLLRWKLGENNNPVFK